MNEYIMTSLRTMWGMDMAILQADTSKSQVLASLKKIDPGFYILENNILKLTQKGKHYADRIAADLFLEDEG
jgi:oxygen-independent coproporphyrinogen-3 oxidase